MPIDLNNRQQINELDQSHVLASIEQLPDQIQDAWTQTAFQDYREFAKGVNHIVVSGMGGSALGGYVVKSLAKDLLKVPLEVVNDYNLPNYIDQNTLVILSSYSGTTEETLAGAIEAKSLGARIAVITSGGDLLPLAEQQGYPLYHIVPTYNPSNQPRMAIGYAITGMIGLLKSFDLIDSSHFNIDSTVGFLRTQNNVLNPESLDNIPKQLAQSAVDKIISLVSAEHLIGAAHVFNNQLNENAKHLTAELKLPELNHHYMEALSHPEAAKQMSMFWFINSDLYSPKLQLRIKLTQDVVTKNGYPSKIIQVTANDPFTQVFELIQMGAYTNFYLAMLHGINPAPIPWVDYFKSQLK